MLFNSYIFIFAFLPVALGGFYLLGRTNRSNGSALWLIAISLFFYAWWNPRYLVLLGLSITGNYVIGRTIDRARRGVIHLSPKILLCIGVALNLILLGYYKYTGLLVTTYDGLFHQHFEIAPIVLPLAISFFTFTQIAYLVDAYHGETTSYDFQHYVLFVTFFPHLIAGPIVSYRRLGPQFSRKSAFRIRGVNVAAGLSLFALGLAKKVLIADNLAPLARTVFDTLPQTGKVPLLLAWMGALAYTFQIYFDFSGYSDMAIGLARMFNVKFPLNFNSPYKSRDISDFWRRWHITLSTFLRDHLYIPLGGNRKGEGRRCLNLMVTMLLGGLWHGAGWNYVIWGGLHGMYLVAHRLWQRRVAGIGLLNGRAFTFGGRALTLLSVVAAWVFFRAHTLEDARNLLAGMGGLHGLGLPLSLKLILSRHGLGKPAWFTAWPGGGAIPVQFAMTIAAALVALLSPNTEQLTHLADHPSGTAGSFPGRRPWTLSVPWALVTGVLLAVSILQLTRLTEFLYFQF
jgi:D-alanyl-lipoteichoic acid acyltransferase DltB (MBOAT superfamily)